MEGRAKKAKLDKVGEQINSRDTARPIASLSMIAMPLDPDIFRSKDIFWKTVYDYIHDK